MFFFGGGGVLGIPPIPLSAPPYLRSPDTPRAAPGRGMGGAGCPWVLPGCCRAGGHPGGGRGEVYDIMAGPTASLLQVATPPLQNGPPAGQ